MLSYIRVHSRLWRVLCTVWLSLQVLCMTGERMVGHLHPLTHLSREQLIYVSTYISIIHCVRFERPGESSRQ